MEDNYLDKVFQDKLESPQHFDFDETAWDNLAARLEDEPNRRIIPWQWFAAAGIVLPLLLSSVYFYQQLRQTEKKVANLEAQFDNLADNIAVEKTEKQIIETPTFVEEMSNGLVANNANSLSPIFRNDSKLIAEKAMSTINQTKVVEALTTPNKNIIINNNNNNNTHKENSENKNLENVFAFGENANYLNKIVYTSAKTTKKIVDNRHLDNWIKQEKVLDIKENNWDRTKYIFIPVGFEIGAVYQTGVTLAQDLPLEQKPYFNIQGVRGAINFANNVDLTIGANYSTASFETQTIGQDFPHVIPTEPSDIFQRVVVSEKVVQIPIGLKYNFGSYDALFSPFVEVGAIARKVVQESHRYEYQPANSGEEHYAVTPKPQPISESLAMNMVTGTLGVTWNPNNKKLENFALQAEIFTVANIENTDVPLTMVGVGVSAKYMF